MMSSVDTNKNLGYTILVPETCTQIALSEAGYQVTTIHLVR
jgi:hypothetical protein